MNGPTLTMAPAVDPAGPFHRSHSSSDLLSYSKPTLSQHQRNLSCKSLPSLPAFEIPSFDSGPEFDTTLFLDGQPLSLSNPKKKGKQQQPLSTTRDEPFQSAPLPKAQKLGRSNTVSDRTRSWLATSKSATNIRDFLADDVVPPIEDDIFQTRNADGRETKGAPRPRVVSDSFVTFSRRSWMPEPRSSSPQTTPDAVDVPKLSRDRIAANATSKFSMPRKRASSSLEAAREAEASRSAESLRPSRFNRASTYLTKIKGRPSNMLGKLGSSSNDSDNSCASSATSLAPPTNATDTVTSKSTSVTDYTTTDDSSVDMASRGRDPLWSVFKNLDIEFGKFGSKTTAQRMQMVRTTLLGFLHRYGNHSSNKKLHPEDTDRRAVILNKWWGGLLDMLEGQGQQPLPGVDRLPLVEATTMVMMRPEWRQTTSYLMPLADRSPYERVRARSGSQTTGTSLSSSEAAFLTESAEHNVRTMFLSNLLRQTELVVDKMSQRHAPLGLVNFCGKALAYAFFFVPGVADVLVRLWGLSAAEIQRVADEFHLPRKSRGESEDIVALFPPNMGSLGWSSVKSMGAALKRAPKMPLGVARIPWQSPWISRWRGRDTDLFFIFTKYFHILAEGFMPSGLPLVEKARAPAFVLVHSQMLSIMDTTIHRQAALEAFAAAPPISDASHGLDASATALPGLPNDLLKGMSENRLIVLLKDFLSEGSTALSGPRHTFAEAFHGLMRAAARRTSQFNHNACHTLCDFLEETLMIYDGFEDVDDPAMQYIDWDFWFQACKLILDSLNSMSEMRVLCFVYTIWDAVAKEPKRKERLCLDWLLAEKTFDSFFNHWCPMVRAYYMRLLCWRICRDTGSANEVDTKIFLTVAARLKTVWAHYLYMKAVSEIRGCFPPSSAPSYPTPGKKFMIIRTELNMPQPGLFMGFDTIGRLPNEGTDADDSAESVGSRGEGKKRWSLLGLNKVLSFKNDGPGGTSGRRKPSLDDDFEQARRDLAAARSRSGSGPPPPPKNINSSGNSVAGVASPGSDASSTGSNPIYDAQQYMFRFILNWYPPAAIPPVDRILSRPRLPAPAQSWVSARGRSDSQPPIPAGLPGITRRYSGSPHTGLVSEARNATPLHSHETEPAANRLSFSSSLSRALTDKSTQDGFERPSFTSDRPSLGERPSLSSERPSLNLSFIDRTTMSTPDNLATPTESVTQPIKPGGIYVKNSVYAGRALAEWGIVVNECNNFIERRREEGVLGLSEVEVPTLAVEGFRRIG